MALQSRPLTGSITAQNRSDAMVEERYARRTPVRRDVQHEPRVYTSDRGSHMPLDLGIHWDWRNPLNLIPASVLLGLIVAVVALLW